MTKKKTRAVNEVSGQRAEAASVPQKTEETPFEAVASICSVLVVGLYILTFLAQNFVIPSGSMEKTLLVGDHLVVDRITLAPPAKMDAAGALSRAAARRHCGLHQARGRAPARRRRQSPVLLPGQAPHRRARRPHSPARRHRLHQRSCAAAAEGRLRRSRIGHG